MFVRKPFIMLRRSESPKISIIIPSYNKVKYIGSTLDSIVFQKYPNCEVIIQDGGSKDGTLEVIKEYAKRWPFIKWESKADRGQVDAINKGLRKSTGEIATFINADDVYLKGAFKLIAEGYLKNPSKLWFVGKGVVIDEKGKKNKSAFYRFWVKPYKNLLLKINSRNLLLCVDYIMQPSVFLNRKALREFGLFSGTSLFVTEYKKWLDLSAKEMPVIISEEISAFRMGVDNITSIRTSELLGEDFRLVKRYTENPFILGLHLLNNLGRLISINLVKQ